MHFLPGKRTLIGLLAVFAVLMIATAASATGTLFAGYLTTATAGDITATDGWAGTSDGFKIRWVVTEVSTGVVHYQYYITNALNGGALAKDLSHIIIQVSDDATSANFTGLGDPTTYTATSEGNSNPNLPGAIFGFKFDGTTIDFYSTREPMLGNFYAKDGVDPTSNHIDVTAWNTGLTGGTGFISVPDSGDFVVLPLPPSALLLGSGLLGLVGLGWRRRKNG